MTKQELNQRIAIINALADDPQRMYDSAARLYEEGQNVGLFLQGNALSLMDKDKEAFRLFLRYTQLEPNDADGWQYAGMMADAIHETVQALQLLTHAVDMGNMDAACAYASVLVGKGIDLCNQAVLTVNTTRYEKINEQAADSLLEALGIYDFLAQEMPDKLGDGDWATLQNCIGSLYMLELSNRLPAALAATKLQSINKFDEKLKKQADNPATSKLLADKIEQVAAIMEHAGRKADAAMTRCRQRVEDYNKTKDSQSMQEAEALWAYAMQEADRAFGGEKEDWLAYYEPLQTDYLRLHRRYKSKLHIMKRNKAVFYKTEGSRAQETPLAAATGMRDKKRKKQTAAVATPGDNQHSSRTKSRIDWRGIPKQAFYLFCRDFTGKYLFTILGGLLGGLAQSGLWRNIAVTIPIYAAGLLVALVGVIKSLRSNPSTGEKLLALSIHVIIWLLMTFLMLPIIILMAIGAIVRWGINKKKAGISHDKTSAQPGRSVGMPRRIFDLNGNVWHRKSSSRHCSTYYRSGGQKEKIYHRTISGNHAYGKSGIGFRW